MDWRWWQPIGRSIASAEPYMSFMITIVDDRLRLLVGADDSNGCVYGFAEIDITPGLKQCDVYRFDNVLAITIKPAWSPAELGVQE